MGSQTSQAERNWKAELPRIFKKVKKGRAAEATIEQKHFVDAMEPVMPYDPEVTAIPARNPTLSP